jgi:hypothetical protein
VDPFDYIKWQQANFQFTFLSTGDATTTVEDLMRRMDVVPMERSVEIFAEIIGSKRQVSFPPVKVANKRMT